MISTNYKIYEYPKDCYRPLPYKRIGKRNHYINIFGCFDIETTNVDCPTLDDPENKIAIMYIWQYTDSDDRVYYGRTWQSLKRFVLELVFAYDLSQSKKMVWYIHNLAFEFQFLRSVFNISDVFAAEVRKPIYCTINNVIELRCSYRLTNMSLEKFCQWQQTPFQKQKGFDYEKARYPDTALTDDELLYCIMDVLSLHQSVTKLMKSENDTIRSIPLTSTGYVRRDARLACNDSINKRLIYSTALDTHTYKLCHSATRGGDTHANIYYIGTLLDNVYSYDRSSSYPHVMVTGDKFPVTKFITERKYKYKEPSKGLAAIMLIEYQNIRLKPHHYIPYLPFSRALRILHPKWNDNGRVLSCEYFAIVITDIDFEIIRNNYDYDDCIIHEIAFADRGQLPKAYREYIMELYIKKSELKDGDPYFYMKFKNKLNATFGMMLTDIVHDEIVYNAGQWQDTKLADVDEAIRKYYSNPNSFLMYQAGVYVTAMARLELRKSIDICGIDTVYVDTDSNKHINDHSKDFEALNAQIHSDNLKNDIVPIVTVNGKQYEMGIWEDEGNGEPEYAQFVTMGAKKYAYQYPSGKYGVTVAGLNKNKGAELLSSVGLEQFSDGLIFDPTYAGRLTAKYDDEIRLEKQTFDGHVCEVTSNVALIPTSYTLGLENNFAKAAHEIKNGETVETMVQ